MGAYIFLAPRGPTDVISDPDNSTFRTLRYVISDPTQERRHRSCERGGEVGEKGRKQVVPQGRTRLLEFPYSCSPPGTGCFLFLLRRVEAADIVADGSKWLRN